MKKLCLALALAAASAPSSLWAQAPAATAPAAATPAATHQVGLIDMAHVFKNYQKFSALTESLQSEIEQTDSEAKALVQKFQQLQGQLSSGSLQEGSPEFTRIESDMLKAQTDLESFKRVAQRDFLRKEAEIYKTVYLEVEDAVQRYASYYKYTLVLRFSRDNVNEATDPKEIINGMNRQVVHFRSEDDITDPILDYLNSAWQKQNGGLPAAGAATKTPAESATRPETKRLPTGALPGGVKR
ncbi:OmpH family outer membrane protein [Planctomicrobium piriforme]|uniref:OmpH family outer membrane protein n=1 Tax=Planctomicrobium piriforme TaxID=1576369 RepID=UPI0015873183|nr:OmpH family outer membrane protein [Planctomicrobium piriforme]